MSKRKPYELTDVAADARVYWSSLENLEEIVEKSPELQQRIAQEFPAGASELNDTVSRRTFVSLMSASIAMATLEGCRRPVEQVLPYTRMPENVIPGVPSHYATVIDRRGEALGLLVESHEGRPTKIEGNPDHPSSRGSADLLAQASVLDLYDPDRSRQPRQGRVDKTWAQFETAFEEMLAAWSGNGGQGLHILAQPTNSPTFMRLRELVRQQLGNARFHTYEAATLSNVREGARLAFGTPVTSNHAFNRARVIVSLESDFLQTDPGAVVNMRLFANGRRLRSAADAMSRLYQIESTHSTTGTNADHRLRLPSGLIERYALALAARLATSHGVQLAELGGPVTGATPPPGVPEAWINAVAADLANNRGGSILIAGPRQPPAVHALVHSINAALGNVGTTVWYSPITDRDEPDQAADLRALAQAMEQGQVDSLLILGGNPVYDAPGDLDFGRKLERVRNSVHLSSHRDETTERCTWHANRAHYLETWGDQRSLDGTVSVQQPLIAPLYASRSDIEILGMIAKIGARDGHALVRETLHSAAGGIASLGDREWRRALHQGLVENSSAPAMSNLTARASDVAMHLRSRPTANPPARNNLEVVFLTDPKMLDGRHANNPWLQELPDPLTKITWDNAAYISPATARELGIDSGDMLRLTKSGRSIEIAAWILPGQADYSIGLPLGWGRTRAGRVGNGHGVNVNPLRASDAMHFMDGVTVEKLGRRYRFSQTQDHHSMEGRPIGLDSTLERYHADPQFAERRSPTPRTLPLWREVEYNGHKWGMTIDLHSCTGCNACAVACQAENNVPVVGKDQVYRGREMHWLRVDRYFAGAVDNPETVHQPLACVQCEEAPCENVCPVAATSHSPEGLNDMAYNRCIGTRYCANNCPYKVRRFNYMNWHTDEASIWRPDSDVPESVRMQHNPNVTVRFRGVMEKCTYCVQRIQTVKIAAKRDNRAIHDGEIVPACAQTCPTEAIVFGDLNDHSSRVRELSNLDRHYKLLADLGTQPRTTYLARIRNPNPEMQG